MRGDPSVLSSTADGGNVGRTPGIQQLERLLHAGLFNADDKEVLHPTLATDVPSLENGLWTLSPDGRMETTWKLHPNAAWQDGAPFTSQDLAFTYQVSRDGEVGVFRDAALDSVDKVETPDRATVTLYWNRPFIAADSMFGGGRSLPIPYHLLHQTYTENRDGFLNARYWSDDFVGAGPFRLQEWVRGSHLKLAANDRFVLGRPKIDDLLVKIIPDPDTILANILAVDVDLTLGQTLSVDQALQLRQRWTGGTVNTGALMSAIGVWPQMMTPSPAAIGDARFRRALLQTIDRQEIVDNLLPGLSQVAHGRGVPGTSEYEAIERSIVRYQYDPDAAARVIEGFGYRKGPDGLFRDSAGQPLSIEVRSTIGRDDQEKSRALVAIFWQRVGIDATEVVIPPQRASDREYRATFPGLEVVNQGMRSDGLIDFYRFEIATPENRFTGKNRSRYDSPELEGLISRFYSTVPREERLGVLRRIVAHLSEQVIPLPLFYSVSPSIISARTRNITPAGLERDSAGWDAQNWDVQ